jgi:Flp pilus assembly protein TadD
MPDNADLAEFKRGIEFLQNGYSAKALEYFRHAAELKQQNPYYLSFLGVSMARAQGKWTAAAELCKTALSLRRNEPQLYLNLAEVYVSAGQRDDAVETLDIGLRYSEQMRASGACVADWEDDVPQSCRFSSVAIS